MAEHDDAEQMTASSSVSIVWRRKWLILVPVVLAGATALLLALSQTPIYKASAEVLVRLPPTANSLAASGSEITQGEIENELSVASGSTLQDQVRETVGTEPALSVESRTDSDVFEFTATSSNADAAAFAANAYAEKYVESQAAILIDEYTARSEVLESQIADIDAGEADESRRAEYEREVEDLEVSTQLATTSGAVVVRAASPPSSAFEPDTIIIVALSLGAGLLIGLAAAFLLERFDPKTDKTEYDNDNDNDNEHDNDNEDDLIEASGLTLLATIPKLDDWVEGTTHVVTREEPFSASAEAYRSLRSALQLAAVDRPTQLVLVASPSPGDGKSTTASNLAITAARSGQRVLLIDCDLRTPRLQHFFNLPNDTGFTSVLLGEMTLPRVAQTISGEGNLLVITSGPLPSDPAALLAGESLQATLGSLGDRVDLVILDAPAVLTVDDSSIIAALADGVIVVASAESTDAVKMIDTVSRLNEAEAPILGMVLNGVNPRAAAIAEGDHVDAASEEGADDPEQESIEAPS